MENFVHQIYKSFRLVKNFEFIECTNSRKFNGKSKNVPVECTNSRKFDGKSKNIPNHENSMQNCVLQMYKYSGPIEKFVFVQSTKP